MLRIYLILLLSLSYTIVTGQGKALLPYIEFIEKQQTNPVDYVFELFDKYDIVVLGERDHRDTTQYILIEKIMSDPRFIQKVGHVFTEVGVCNQTDNANRVLKNNYSSEDDFTRELRKLYQNIDYEVIWEKYNYWYFLNSIYRINKHLSQEQKISLHLTDVPYDWNECRDTITRKNFLNQLTGSYRDIVMGVNIIRGFDRILQDPGEYRKKALVILNRPHSFQNYIYLKNDNSMHSMNSAASYVFDYYPGKVANIMINWRKLTDKDYLIADGKWDAAFHFLKNPSIGFDLKDSPLGEDVFDHYGRNASETKYRDIYTGFIFYLPIEDWVITLGIPGIVTEDFTEELMRRESLTPRPFNNLESAIEYYGNKRIIDMKDDGVNVKELILNLKKWKVKRD